MSAGAPWMTAPGSGQSASRPVFLDTILADAAAPGFVMPCEDRTGALPATLAAGKPGGRFVGLGTGVGAGTAWPAHGMDLGASLTSVERDPKTQAVATAHLGQDNRVTFVQDGADQWVARNRAGSLFDLAYVDCRPGKFLRLADLLALLEPGGLYIVDDLLPQDTWPADHPNASTTSSHACPIFSTSLPHS
ncbi:O-methyltransferase [Streptomyces sp. NPDC054766]